MTESAPRVDESGFYPAKYDAHKAHKTCCKGQRVAGQHSDYCFSQRVGYNLLPYFFKRRTIRLDRWDPVTLAAIKNGGAESNAL